MTKEELDVVKNAYHQYGYEYGVERTLRWLDKFLDKQGFSHALIEQYEGEYRTFMNM